MQWTYKGKHEGRDINEVPTDYLQWCYNNSKNDQARAKAKEALQYRGASLDMSTDSKSGTTTGKTGKGSVIQSRYYALDLCIKLQCVPEGFNHLGAVTDYLAEGKLPMTKTEEITQPVDEDDEIPF
jgi:hypothetical protein